MQVVQTDISELERLFSLYNKERIAETMTPELLQLVLEARLQVLKYFPDTALALEWQDDPEEEPLSGLILWVNSDLEFEKAHELENKLGAAWWYANAKRVNSRLSILVDGKDEF
jgi:hypothetical protein